MKKKKITFFSQLNAMDCGPTCLRMVAKFYGRNINASIIRELAGYSKEGVTMLGISEAAERIGFNTNAVKLTFEQLLYDGNLPCILHWNQSHFVTLISITVSKFGKNEMIIKIADPACGIIKYNKKEFLYHWISSNIIEGERQGTALLLEPTSNFYLDEIENKKQLTWKLILNYLQNSKWKLIQVFVTLLITSVFQIIFPFLTQKIVDVGIQNHDIQFVTIILIAQLMLVFSRAILDFIRSRILLLVSTIVNLSILSDFWIKLTNLPISYFDNHHTGDTLQRLEDHKKLQIFLTGSAINTFFSSLTFIVFAFILAFYNIKLFLVFFIGSIIYIFWILYFLRIRRKLNYQTFHLSAKENGSTLQLIQGMQEIRLNNAEQKKRWEWENIQSDIFKLNFKSLSYSQFQQVGSLIINHGKDVVITFLVANLVIKNQLTLGAMLAIQYIVGQLSGPIDQLIDFVQSAQDAKISMERLNEIHLLNNEENLETHIISNLPIDKSIYITNLTFSYPRTGLDPVINNFCLKIPEQKVTAIVGSSGSGKTTIIKLLLKIYTYSIGEIKIGNIDFAKIKPDFWRNQCGAVLQDGYIFNDNIVNNIGVGSEKIDYEKLIHCCKVANIYSFIESLPNGFNTQLGLEGIGLSQGQKQRLLIARAIYKEPEYLFFDEATNALDSNNEKIIVENLQEYFKGKTVVVVAHRLSTVKNADKIIVLHEGHIVEEGTHNQLVLARSRYYELVKNQLELGN